MPEISGIPVSTVGLGCNNFGMTMDQDQASDVVSAALDCGMNFFDTADVYGGTKSETFLGQALTGRRDEAVVTTKFGVLTTPGVRSRPASDVWAWITWTSSCCTIRHRG